MPPILYTLDLGLCTYENALSVQHRIHARCRTTEENVLLFAEHVPVVTIGYRRAPGHLRCSVSALGERGIGFAEVERGGGATYHGPGQLVGYPIFASLLRRYGVRTFIARLEEVMIRLCLTFSVSAGRKGGYPGAWVGERKIGAVGIAIRDRVSLHGWALNVNLDLQPFSLIVPCGLVDKEMTSLARELDAAVSMAAVRDRARGLSAEVFAADIKEIPDEWCRIE
jgi:lipoate-protein ligase B